MCKANELSTGFKLLKNVFNDGILFKIPLQQPVNNQINKSVFM